MLQTWIHRITPDKEARLRAWFSEMDQRREELRESFAAAGVRAEQAYVISGVTGTLLVYVSEADDHARAERVYAASTLSIDVEHRAVMQECVEQTIAEAPAYDVAF